MRLRDKVAVITGAGSGIGRTTAELFAREGAKVVVVDRDLATATETANAIQSARGEAIALHADVTKEEEVQATVRETVLRFGGLHILFNNAGTEGFHPAPMLEDMPAERWDAIIDVNLKAVMLCCKHVIPEMRKNGGGAIVNTASVMSFVGYTKSYAYCASKSGVLGLTRAMALDYADDRIRVNCICPGWVETAMVRRITDAQENPEQAYRYFVRMHPLGRLGRPEDIAYGALYLASDEASFVTGTTLAIDGGFLAK